MRIFKEGCLGNGVRMWRFAEGHFFRVCGYVVVISDWESRDRILTKTEESRIVVGFRVVMQ